MSFQNFDEDDQFMSGSRPASEQELAALQEKNLLKGSVTKTEAFSLIGSNSKPEKEEDDEFNTLENTPNSSFVAPHAPEEINFPTAKEASAEKLSSVMSMTHIEKAKQTEEELLAYDLEAISRVDALFRLYRDHIKLPREIQGALHSLLNLGMKVADEKVTSPIALNTLGTALVPAAMHEVFKLFTVPIAVFPSGESYYKYCEVKDITPAKTSSYHPIVTLEAVTPISPKIDVGEFHMLLKEQKQMVADIKNVSQSMNERSEAAASCMSRATVSLNAAVAGISQAAPHPAPNHISPTDMITTVRRAVFYIVAKHGFKLKGEYVVVNQSTVAEALKKTNGLDFAMKFLTDVGVRELRMALEARNRGAQ